LCSFQPTIVQNWPRTDITIAWLIARKALARDGLSAHSRRHSVLHLISQSRRCTSSNDANAASLKSLKVRDDSHSSTNGLSNKATIAIVMGVAAILVPIAIFFYIHRETSSPRTKSRHRNWVSSYLLHEYRMTLSALSHTPRLSAKEEQECGLHDSCHPESCIQRAAQYDCAVVVLKKMSSV
jgi:hypothetical protein